MGLFFLLLAAAVCLDYNQETRRLFIGQDNGTISVSIMTWYIGKFDKYMLCINYFESKICYWKY